MRNKNYGDIIRWSTTLPVEFWIMRNFLGSNLELSYLPGRQKGAKEFMHYIRVRVLSYIIMSPLRGFARPVELAFFYYHFTPTGFGGSSRIDIFFYHHTTPVGFGEIGGILIF